MSTAVEVPASFLSRHHFLLRRLHSLSGIVPIGAFLVVHLLTNSLIFFGPERFDAEVAWIHDLPYLPVLEFGGILLPIAFHAWYGVIIARGGRSNVEQYGYFDNYRYMLQRVTGWIALVFIVVHLFHFRFAHWFGGPEYQVIAHASGAYVATLKAWGLGLPTPVWTVWYLAGVLASAFHFCNGISTFCVTWGITVGDVARRRVLAGCGALFVVLVAWGCLSLWGLNTAKAVVENAPAAALAAGAAGVHPVGEVV